MRPAYTRTSWNVGLATCADDPAPRATPRTKVVFPAPRSPSRSIRSPCRRLRPSCSPAASVSAEEVVTASSKVVEAPDVQLKRHVVSADHVDRRGLGQHAERAQPGAPNCFLRPDANQLRLLAAGEGVLPGGAFGERDVRGPDRAARV